MLDRSIRSLFLAAFLLASIFSFSQFTRFKHISKEQGLESVMVYAVTQDKKGYIWVGTGAGIAQYDGYDLVYIGYNGDSVGLVNGSVTNLVVSSDDKLWITFHAGGLNYLDLHTGKLHRMEPDSLNENSISSKFVREIIELPDHRLAMANAAGLDIYDPKDGSFIHYRSKKDDPSGILSNNVKNIELAPDGSLWLSHGAVGISHLDLKTGKSVNFTVGNDSLHLDAANIRDILLDSDGILWISNWHMGLLAINTRNGAVYKQRQNHPFFKGIEKQGLVFDIYEDSDKNIWFATAESGIVRFNKKNREVIVLRNDPDDAESIADNTAMCIFEDHSGCIWAGTWRGGLNYFNKRSLNFGYFKHQSNSENTLHNNMISAAFKDDDGKILLGTASGIAEFDTKQKKFSRFYMDKNDGHSIQENSSITSICKDHEGTYWIGANGGGLYRYEPSSRKYSQYAPVKGDTNSFGDDTPLAIVEDRNGDIWVATNTGGLCVYNRKRKNFSRVRHLSNEEIKNKDNRVEQLLMDKHGILWFSTESHGLFRMDPATRKPECVYNKKNPKYKLQTLGISCIMMDRKERMWMSTYEGILCYDTRTGKAENITEKNEQLEIGSRAILEDRSGLIWFPGVQGLVKYDPNTNTASTFLPGEGLQGREFDGGTCLVLDNGWIIAGGLNGFNYFDPTVIEKSKKGPDVIITDFSVLNENYNLPEDISYTDSITLSYKDYFFSINIAADEYTDPAENRFKYKLEGFNENWVQLKKQNSITFTNLDHGDYTLRILARNSNGTWGENERRLFIRITPPFYKTAWFYLLCTFTGIAFIYGFIRYRERKLKKEKEKLEIKVAERTEELNVEKKKVEEAHRDIKDSIQYAQRIQKAILSPEQTLKEAFADSFILYKPRDIVSGDFYWILHIDDPSKNKNILVFAAADCTGHGVPGAFMSMLNSTLLNQTAYNPEIATPADALNFLNRELPKNLHTQDNESAIKDGMDIGFGLIDLRDLKMKFAGANNPCWIVRDKELIELAPTKQAITASEEFEKKTFTDAEIQLQKGDCVYVFTDGFADQFGGPRGKKFKYKTLANLLRDMNGSSMPDQKKQLDRTFTEWKGSLEQVDDVCIIGIRI